MDQLVRCLSLMRKFLGAKCAVRIISNISLSIALKNCYLKLRFEPSLHFSSSGRMFFVIKKFFRNKLSKWQSDFILGLIWWLLYQRFFDILTLMTFFFRCMKNNVLKDRIQKTFGKSCIQQCFQDYETILKCVNKKQQVKTKGTLHNH